MDTNCKRSETSDLTLGASCVLSSGTTYTVVVEEDKAPGSNIEISFWGTTPNSGNAGIFEMSVYTDAARTLALYKGS